MAGHKDWGGLSSAHGLDLWMMSKDPEIIRSYRSIITMDPPEHERFRALVSRVLRHAPSRRSSQWFVK